jgi:DNA-directed RNA polymerase II subunit RPB2
LTYSSPLFVDLKKTTLSAGGVEDPIEADWKPVTDRYGNELAAEEQKVWLGKVCPHLLVKLILRIMLISGTCHGPVEFLSVARPAR